MSRHFNRVAAWVLGGASWLVAAGLVAAGETAPPAQDEPAPATKSQRATEDEAAEKPARCELQVGKTYQLVVEENGIQRKLSGEVTRIEGDTIELTEKTGELCVKVGVPYLSQLPYLSELFSTKIGTRSFRTDDLQLDQILSSSEIDDEADVQDRPQAGLPLAPQGIVLSDGVLLPPPPGCLRGGGLAPPPASLRVPPLDESPVFDWKITSLVCDQGVCPPQAGQPVLPHPIAGHPEAKIAPPVSIHQPTPPCPPTQSLPPGLSFAGTLPPPCPPTTYGGAICVSTNCPSANCATSPYASTTGPPRPHGPPRPWIKLAAPRKVCVVTSCRTDCGKSATSAEKCPGARPSEDWPSYHDLVQQSVQATVSEARATARLEALQESLHNREELMQAVMETMVENARLQAAVEHHEAHFEMMCDLLEHKAELAAAQAKLQAQAEFQQHVHRLQEENAALQRHVAELERLARQRPPKPALPTVRQAESSEPPERK